MKQNKQAIIRKQKNAISHNENIIRLQTFSKDIQEDTRLNACNHFFGRPCPKILFLKQNAKSF